MAIFLLFVLASVGLTAVMVESEVGEFFKNQLLTLCDKFGLVWLADKVEKVFNCHRCMGVWCGWVSGFCLLPWDFGTLFMSGFAGSCAAVLSAFFINYLETISVVEYREKDDNE